MTDRGIIFSAPMVRALLDGRKTQTRRVLKPLRQSEGADYVMWPVYDYAARGFQRCGSSPLPDRAAPYAPGCRLWVREAWRYISGTGSHLWDGARQYRADGAVKNGRWMTADEWGEIDPANRWRSPIHMPRWASRLTLTVTDVRVQRLQEISEADARAEGVDPIRHEWWQGFVRRPDGTRGMTETLNAALPPPEDFEHPEKQVYERTAKDGFAALWNSLHGPDAWAANPWVAALTFTVHRGNIDRMGGDD